MAFDPTQPFEVVEDPQAQAGGAPRFDPSQAFEVVDDGQTGLIEGVGNSIKRGWTMSQMASEMEKPAPDPQRVAALQQEMQAAPPSDEYMTVMDDRRAPEESWTAFKSAPVKVLAELMGESFSAFAGQMIQKAPNRVAIGLGAGAAMGAPVAGIGAVPGGFIGAGAGFAEASGAASYSLEMAGGVLEAMEQAGVPLDNPEALGQALQDPQRMQLAREFAQRKAVPIAIFDGASAVIGGRMFGGGKVTSAMQRLGQGMAETFTQAAMGASGEASGQLAQSGEITSGRAILAEGVAEIPTGLVEIGAGQLSQSGATANQPAATAPAATAPQPAPFTPPPAAETVVVEEVFGDPTTAAAEPVAETAPAFDPSQPFEVVQEPSETIVTEPAAAPRFQFDLADDTATAPEMDAEADVFAGVPQQPALAKMDRGEPSVTQPVSLPESGFGSVYQQVRQGNPVWMVQQGNVRGFGDSIHDTEQDAINESVLERSRREERAKSLQAMKDKDANDARLKADREDLGSFAEGMTSMQRGKITKQLSKNLNYRGELISRRDLIQKMVSEGRTVDSEEGQRVLSNKDGEYLGENVLTKAGMDYATHLIVAQQPAPKPAQEKAPVVAAEPQPAVDEAPAGGVEYFRQLGAQDALDPSRKRKRAVPQNFKLAYLLAWSDAKKAEREQGPAQVKTPAAATEKVATEMAASTVDPSRPVPASVRDGVIAQLQNSLTEVAKSGDKGRERVTVSIPGDGTFQIIKTEESIKKAIAGLSRLSAPVSTALPRVTLTESVREIDNYAGVLEETLGIEGAIEDQQALLKQAGENTSIGKAAAKTIEALQRRAEVRAGNAPAQRSRRRIKKMTAQSGAIDLSIVEDLVEYGKTIYRAGMSFGKWAGQMVKEFGQGIASFLKQAFDRIVQAYKDSPYSDTTGAVGDVRPKAKPRQFEQKAAQAPGISEEARAQMGDDPYVPITLRGVAEQAKAWIAENGIEAAERRILGLADEGQTPTPLDFAIGLELTGNLSAMRQNNRAASVVRTMSRRATSLGQTISTLAMLSRLTPEGIVFYANQIIEQHIGSLSPERQAEIAAAQKDVAELEKTVVKTRRDSAHDAILEGTQGGEKIADKIRRRIPDKNKSRVTLTSVRSVLTSQATKAEATKQITQILTESGISQSEATALATAITNRFYKVLEDARKSLANSRKPTNGKGRATIDKLLTQLKDGKITDEEFVSALAQVKGVPALTAADKARIQNLATQYKASTDDQVSLVLAARLFEEVHSIIPPDFWVKLRALSYLSMLFAPKTWIRNIGGNQIQWIANAGRDAVINMVVDPTMSLLTGRRTSAFGNTKRLRSLLTPIEDVIRGYKWNQQQNPSASVMENMRAGIEHLRVLAKMTTQNKFEITDAKEVGRRIFSSKFMASWETALSIALGGGDRGFWMSAFTASLGQREAAAKKNGEWTGQPTPEDIEAAYADAMHAIYQNPNVISQSANRIRAALNRISTFGRTDQFGLGTALLAFTQVPGSITMRGLIEWSPLGMINALYEGMRPLLYKATNGKGGGSFRQEQFNKAFTQALLGSGGLFVGGYWLYALGVVTASREEDDDLEAMRRASGLGGYRVNLSALKRLFSTYTKQEPEDGDLIVSYDWAQPLAITFAAGAELAKQVEQNDREGIKKGLAGKAGMAAISLAAGAKSLEEQPLLSGLSSFMKTWGYSGPLDAIVNTISGIPSMFVPQLVRQANQLMDNTVRETRGDEGVLRAFSRIAANTPGVADQFPPRMDIMGQAIERYQYAGNTVINVLINPTMTSRVKTNPALQEVARLMQTTGEASQAPRQVGRSVAINGENINLSNEQISAYQYYLGNYTMSMFNWRMASPRYARLPDTEKVKLLAQDLEDVNAATKSALFGHDVRRLTRRQRVMRANLVNSPLGQSMPPR
jgi:hypothetical protein